MKRLQLSDKSETEEIFSQLSSKTVNQMSIKKILTEFEQNVEYTTDTKVLEDLQNKLAEVEERKDEAQVKLCFTRRDLYKSIQQRYLESDFYKKIQELNPPLLNDITKKKEYSVDEMFNNEDMNGFLDKIIEKKDEAMKDEFNLSGNIIDNKENENRNISNGKMVLDEGSHNKKHGQIERRRLINEAFKKIECGKSKMLRFSIFIDDELNKRTKKNSKLYSKINKYFGIE